MNILFALTDWNLWEYIHMMSIVEEKILSKDFTYEQPWFYNKFSLRCELGAGNDTKYMCNAKNRALQIFRILFSKGVDCLLRDRGSGPVSIHTNSISYVKTYS